MDAPSSGGSGAPGTGALQPGPPGRQPAACAQTPAAGSSALTITSGGVQRSAVVHVPRDAPSGRPLALVLALHGAGGDGRFMQRYTGYSKLADERHFFVVYPSALGSPPFWTLGDGAAKSADVVFIRDLLDQLEGGLCVDPQRVYAVGVSNGGGMVARLGCDLSDRIAAIAPVAGGHYNMLPACQPARPVSVLVIHGTADPVVPYAGIPPDGADGVPSFLAGWVGRDGCSQTPAQTRSGRLTVRLNWPGCVGGASVQHLRIAGGGHQWPGSTPPGRGPRRTIMATLETWRFFRAHRLGG
ncbi:MAG TPA: hypothetical protein VHE14_05500 [Solirubrobacteraceae bacterium]|nr:hypothetical protein [Solirubrobacteraceae bacterium]